jgi:hypothetical protein
VGTSNYGTPVYSIGSSEHIDIATGDLKLY